MQLTLNIKLRDSATFDNYLGDINSTKVSMLRQALSDELGPMADPEHPSDLFYFICGNAGVGKTHLLQAACNEIEAWGERAFYVSLNDPMSLSTGMLAGCAGFDLVCIDNIDPVLGCRDWEVAIFNAFNEVKLQGKSMIVSGLSAPGTLPFSLPDLSSRMASGITLPLQEPLDSVKSEIIRARAKLRGLDMSEEVMTYIMKRSGRGMSDLVGLMQKLDDLSLSAKRRLTVPFIKESLGW